jgi:uncharacterized membrane protein
MGSWSEQQDIKKESKEKDKVRKEKLATYFLDLSKITYTVLVIGLVITLFQNEQYKNFLLDGLVLIGSIIAFVFAKIGNNILKN